MIVLPAQANRRSRAGITLIEILISIMILGIGLVSLATLFPIGLLRLRDAQRSSRSAFLAESAQSDMAARALLVKSTFLNPAFSPWYTTAPSGSYDPFIQDTPDAYADWAGQGNLTNAGVYRGFGGVGTGTQTQVAINGAAWVPGSGLPIAYDPLLRQMAVAYLVPGSPEARFGYGINTVRSDPDGGPPSAYGLQRLTNLGPAFRDPILSAFVSPEDLVWQEAGNTYSMAFNLQDYETVNLGTNQITNPSSIVPDLNISYVLNANNIKVPTYQQTFDFRYTWLFTGQQTDTAGGTIFDGNVVVMENRPFAVDQTSAIPVAGEPVVEAVFGYSTNVIPPAPATLGYGAASNRLVMLRWPTTLPDPEVKVGSWIADVTYERHYATALSRFPLVPSVPGSAANVPAQRCFWYQVSKVTPPADATGALAFSNDPGPYRYMMVWTSSDLRAKTVLIVGTGQPAVVNAALVSPYVVNVFPRTFIMKQP